MSDDEFYKSLYGPTGKPPAPEKEPAGKFEQLATGFGQGLANPVEAPLKWAGHPELIPDWAKDLEEKNKQGGFWGTTGEVLGTGLGAAGAGAAAAALLPEEAAAGIAALPWAVRALLGIGRGSLAGLAARYPETKEEMYTQLATGGLLGGAGGVARGLTSGGGIEGAGAHVAGQVDPKLLAAWQTAEGNARHAESLAQSAWNAALNNPGIQWQQRAAALAQRAGQARAAADAAKEAASRRPWGVYQNIHEFLHPKWTTLKNIAGQVLSNPGAAGGAAGVVSKDQ